MATTARPISPAEHLERRIVQNLADAERWRAEHGDPSAALGAYMRERFGLDAIMETYREHLLHEDSVDDYLDNEDEDAREPG